MQHSETADDEALKILTMQYALAKKVGNKEEARRLEGRIKAALREDGFLKDSKMSQ